MHTGMAQAAMGLELPHMQSQNACQLPGQTVRLEVTHVDLDTLGQDDFDLTGSALAGRRHDRGPSAGGQAGPGPQRTSPQRGHRIATLVLEAPTVWG